MTYDVSGACACLGQQNGEPFCPCQMRRIAESKEIAGSVGISVFERETWNAAIEAAAKITEHSGYCEQIRKLKK